MYPYSNPSILSKSISLLKNVKWSSLLDGTSKTLGVINQAIPVFYQIKPIIGNAKTLFKIANTINSNDDEKNIKKQEEKEIISNTSPIFYI